MDSTGDGTRIVGLLTVHESSVTHVYINYLPKFTLFDVEHVPGFGENKDFGIKIIEIKT